MKKFLKSLCLVLACVMCVSVLAACADESDDTPPPINLAEYKIVFSGESEYSAEAAAALQLKKSISEKFGISLESNDDYLKSGESYNNESKEILVGHTGYEQSKSAAQTVSRLDFLIKVDGNKIILIAGRANGLGACVEHFIENYLEMQESVLALKSTEEYSKTYDYSTVSTTGNLASLNLRYAYDSEMNSQGAREPRVVEFIKQYQPHSFGVQECEAYWKERLDIKLAEYGYVSAQQEVYDGSTQSTSTYSFKNFIYYNTNEVTLIDSGITWLSETPTVPSKGFDSIYYISVGWAILESKDTGARYVHMNTHLNVDSAVIRAQEIEVLLARAKTFENRGYDVFITGDFNDLMTSSSYISMTARYSDARLATTDTLELDYTYNGYQSETEPAKTQNAKLIDFCFFKGNDITIDKFDIVEKSKGGYMSDHNALFVKFTFK